MPLWLAVLLLLLALLGVFLSRRFLSRPAQTVCVVLCILLALACAVYIGLTLLFVDAVSHQPPHRKSREAHLCKRHPQVILTCGCLLRSAFLGDH